jgi:hypothetical protein
LILSILQFSFFKRRSAPIRKVVYLMKRFYLKTHLFDFPDEMLPVEKHSCC